MPQGLAKSGVMGGFIVSLAAEAVDPAVVRACATQHSRAPRGGRAVRGRTLLPQQSSRACARPCSSCRVAGTSPSASTRRTRPWRSCRPEAPLDRQPRPRAVDASPPDTQRCSPRASSWFDRFLRAPATASLAAAGRVAPSAGSASRCRYAGLPKSTPRRPLRSTPRHAARSQTGAQGRLLLHRAADAPLEVFGSPTVEVTATPRRRLVRLVAVLSATTPAGKEIVVAGGGVPTRAGTRTYRSADDQATFLPKGSRLRSRSGRPRSHRALATCSTSTCRCRAGAQAPRTRLTPSRCSPRRSADEAARSPRARRRSSSRGRRRRAGAEPGDHGDEIVIGGTVPLSGEAAAFGAVGPGAKAYFDYVNSRGGVNGRNIRYLFYDDAYNPAQTVQLTRQLVEQDRVFALFNAIGTANNLAIRDYLNASRCRSSSPATAPRRSAAPRAATRGRWASCRATAARGRSRPRPRPTRAARAARRAAREHRARQGHDARPLARDRGQGPEDRRVGGIRVHRRRRRLPGREAEGLRARTR